MATKKQHTNTLTHTLSLSLFVMTLFWLEVVFLLPFCCCLVCGDSLGRALEKHGEALYNIYDNVHVCKRVHRHWQRTSLRDHALKKNNNEFTSRLPTWPQLFVFCGGKMQITWDSWAAMHPAQNWTFAIIYILCGRGHNPT